MDPGILLIVFKSTWLIFYYEKTVLLFPGDQIKGVNKLAGTKTQKISNVASPLYAPVHWDQCDNEIHQSITSVIVDITWIK